MEIPLTNIIILNVQTIQSNSLKGFVENQRTNEYVNLTQLRPNMHIL